LIGEDVGRDVGSNDGGSVGCSVGVSVIGLHSVYAKQLSPEGHSLAEPCWHCVVHLLLAFTYEVPQKKELLSPHGVFPKHVKPFGQSSSPPGQGTPHNSDAWLNVTPQ
jgi:hypothetical protein